MFTGCWMPHVGRDRYAGRGKIPIKPQSEVIRSIVLEDSPYCGGVPAPDRNAAGDHCPDPPDCRVQHLGRTSAVKKLTPPPDFYRNAYCSGEGGCSGTTGPAAAGGTPPSSSATVPATPRNTVQTGTCQTRETILQHGSEFALQHVSESTLQHVSESSPHEQRRWPGVGTGRRGGAPRPAAKASRGRLSAGDTLILLHTPRPLAGASIRMWRGRQRNDRALAGGGCGHPRWRRRRGASRRAAAPWWRRWLRCRRRSRQRSRWHAGRSGGGAAGVR